MNTNWQQGRNLYVAAAAIGAAGTATLFLILADSVLHGAHAHHSGLGSQVVAVSTDSPVPSRFMPVNPKPLHSLETGDEVIVRASYEELLQEDGTSMPPAIHKASDVEKPTEFGPPESPVECLSTAWPRVASSRQIGDVPVLPPAHTLWPRVSDSPAASDRTPTLPQRTTAVSPLMPQATGSSNSSDELVDHRIDAPIEELSTDGGQYFIQILNAKDQSVQVVDGSAFPAVGKGNAAVPKERMGVILSVTPHVGQDGFVTIDAQTEKCQVNSDSDASVVTFTDLTASSFIPASVENAAPDKAIFKARSGETVVLGGVIVEGATGRQGDGAFVFFSSPPVDDSANASNEQQGIEQASIQFVAESQASAAPTAAPQFGAGGQGGVGALVPFGEPIPPGNGGQEGSLDLLPSPIEEAQLVAPGRQPYIPAPREAMVEESPIATVLAESSTTAAEDTDERKQRGIIPTAWRRFPWVIPSRPSAPAIESPETPATRIRPTR
ncbi:MAG: hypothetical protein R3C18_11640 [Planctomycetaceae bacterium]